MIARRTVFADPRVRDRLAVQRAAPRCSDRPHSFCRVAQPVIDTPDLIGVGLRRDQAFLLRRKDGRFTYIRPYTISYNIRNDIREERSMAIKTSDVIPLSQARSRLSEIADEAKAGAEKVITKNGE